MSGAPTLVAVSPTADLATPMLQPYRFLRLACTSPCHKVPILALPTRLSRSTYVVSFRKLASLVPLVARTSNWVQKQEEVDGSEFEGTLSRWGRESADLLDDGEQWEGEDDAKGVPVPPEDAKLYVGNLPYGMDCDSLANLFNQAGIVDIAEIIYNRETNESRGFGFVTMRTVEEAERASNMFNGYESSGRMLIVNKAARKGIVIERNQVLSEPSHTVFVANLPYELEGTRLEQVFSEHGKVVDARVIYDRETGRSRGFGFVTMSSEEEKEDVIAALDGQNLDGRVIKVIVAEGRQRRPSFKR